MWSQISDSKLTEDELWFKLSKHEIFASPPDAPEEEAKGEKQDNVHATSETNADVSDQEGQEDEDDQEGQDDVHSEDRDENENDNEESFYELEEGQDKSDGELVIVHPNGNDHDDDEGDDDDDDDKNVVSMNEPKLRHEGNTLAPTSSKTSSLQHAQKDDTKETVVAKEPVPEAGSDERLVSGLLGFAGGFFGGLVAWIVLTVMLSMVD
jgi:hypothetical protein